MQASLTYDLNNPQEKTKYLAALRVEQLGGIISDSIGYLTEEIEQSKNQESIERLTQVRKFIVDLMCEMDFQEICEMQIEEEAICQK